jgi:hypothetical protein
MVTLTGVAWMTNAEEVGAASKQLVRDKQLIRDTGVISIPDAMPARFGDTAPV